MDELPSIAKDTSTRFHPELDFDRWRTWFEVYKAGYVELLDEMDDEGVDQRRASLETLYGDISSSIDQTETRAKPAEDHAPTDLFILNYGEPPDRSMTKVYGAPYWPADRDWPTDWRGKPLHFTAQINFTDSRDIVGDLPGDILVMFDGFWGNTNVWLSAGIEKLIAPGDIPTGLPPDLVWHGIIARLYDPRPRENGRLPSPLHPELYNYIKVGGAPWGKPARSARGGSFLFQFSGMDFKYELGDAIDEGDEFIVDEDYDPAEDESGDLYEGHFTSCDSIPVTGFLLPNGSVRLRQNRIHKMVKGIYPLGAMHPGFTIADRNTGEGATYEFSLRWPFIHRS